MKTFKWRILLVSINIALVVALSAMGLHESEIDLRNHPEYFYHGNLYYLPPVQIAMYCLEMPAYAASSEFAELGTGHLKSDSRVFTAHLFFYVNWAFFLFVGCFWWWVGWELDRYSRRQTISKVVQYVKATAYLVLCLLSLAMAYDGFINRHSELVAHPIPVAKIVWGLLLVLIVLVGAVRPAPMPRTEEH